MELGGGYLSEGSLMGFLSFLAFLALHLFLFFELELFVDFLCFLLLHLLLLQPRLLQPPQLPVELINLLLLPPILLLPDLISVGHRFIHLLHFHILLASCSDGLSYLVLTVFAHFTIRA